jgi:hypothetical protein
VLASRWMLLHEVAQKIKSGVQNQNHRAAMIYNKHYDSTGSRPRKEPRLRSHDARSI